MRAATDVVASPPNESPPPRYDAPFFAKIATEDQLKELVDSVVALKRDKEEVAKLTGQKLDVNKNTDLDAFLDLTLTWCASKKRTDASRRAARARLVGCRPLSRPPNELRRGGVSTRTVRDPPD